MGLSAGLVLFLLPITKGSDWGWTSPLTLGLFGASVAVLLLWGAMELRLKAPLVDLRTTARPAVLFTNLASIMVGVSFYVVSLVLPQLLQLPKSTGYGLGQSMVSAGLLVTPLGLTMMVTAPVYARLSAKYGPKVTLIIGMVIIGVGYGAGLGLMSAAWQIAGHRRGPGRRHRPGLLLAARADHRLRAGLGDGRGERPQHPDALHRHVRVERRHRHGARQHGAPRRAASRSRPCTDSGCPS